MFRALKSSRAWFLSTLLLSIGLKAAFAEEITVSYASLTAAYMDHLVAIEKGYAAEEGLTVKIIRAGGGVATPKPWSSSRRSTTWEMGI